MKHDINIIWYLVPIAVIVLFHGVLASVGLVTLGMVCLWNFKQCRRVHCVITGPLFIALGGLVALVSLEIVTISNLILQIILLGNVVLAFGVEYWYRRKYGTCYIKKGAEEKKGKLWKNTHKKRYV